MPTLEEVVRDAEKAEAPSIGDRVLSKGGDSPPMVIDGITGDEYIWIYNTKTAERSKIHRLWTQRLNAKLREKFTDGTPIWTTTKPKFEPKRGVLRCMLHAETPDREHYDSLGLPTCRKSNLTSPYQVKRHMEKRHPSEWATLEDERKSKEREEEKEFQRGILNMAKGGEKTAKKFQCLVCDASFDSAIALTGHGRSHK